jgi:hypothetical protein
MPAEWGIDHARNYLGLTNGWLASQRRFAVWP